MSTITQRLTLLLAALSLSMTACGSTTSSDAPEPADQLVAEKVLTPEEEATDSSEASIPETETGSQSPGSFITLTEYETNKATFDDTNVVLFFNAAWCSTCKQARENIQAESAALPLDLTIVDVDFENSDDLRKKYGVTLQHTFVQIDSAGNELAKWSGSVTPSQIAENTLQ